jgi:hypothetical protein
MTQLEARTISYLVISLETTGWRFEFFPGHHFFSIFVSPNQQEDLKFKDANNNPNAKERKAKRNVIKDIMEKLSRGAYACDAIGATRANGARRLRATIRYWT